MGETKKYTHILQKANFVNLSELLIPQNYIYLYTYVLHM